MWGGLEAPVAALPPLSNVAPVHDRKGGRKEAGDGLKSAMLLK